MPELDTELLRPIEARWCHGEFPEGGRGYPCLREAGHPGKHDHPIAQQRRQEYAEALLDKDVIFER
jgi:hypothetical protein